MTDNPIIIILVAIITLMAIAFSVVLAVVFRKKCATSCCKKLSKNKSAFTQRKKESEILEMEQFLTKNQSRKKETRHKPLTHSISIQPDFVNGYIRSNELRSRPISGGSSSEELFSKVPTIRLRSQRIKQSSEASQMKAGTMSFQLLLDNTKKRLMLNLKSVENIDKSAAIIHVIVMLLPVHKNIYTSNKKVYVDGRASLNNKFSLTCKNFPKHSLYTSHTLVMRIMCASEDMHSQEFDEYGEVRYPLVDHQLNIFEQISSAITSVSPHQVVGDVEVSLEYVHKDEILIIVVKSLNFIKTSDRMKKDGVGIKLKLCNSNVNEEYDLKQLKASQLNRAKSEVSRSDQNLDSNISNSEQSINNSKEKRKTNVTLKKPIRLQISRTDMLTSSIRLKFRSRPKKDALGEIQIGANSTEQVCGKKHWVLLDKLPSKEVTMWHPIYNLPK